MVNIMQIAKIVRSKNAGPFLTTIDVFFDKRESYERVKRYLNEDIVAKLYNIPRKDIIGIFHQDVAMGIKISIVKTGGVASGDQDCTDIFGASQHVPMKTLDVP